MSRQNSKRWFGQAQQQASPGHIPVFISFAKILIIRLKHLIYSYFQTFAIFLMLYSFFWVIHRRLNFMCRRFGILCLLHLRRWCKQGLNFMCRRFGTLCLLHLRRWCKQGLNVMCRRFGTLCLLHLRRWCKQGPSFMCRRFGTLCLLHLRRWCKQCLNFTSRRFGTLRLLHLRRWCKQGLNFMCRRFGTFCSVFIGGESSKKHLWRWNRVFRNVIK